MTKMLTRRPRRNLSAFDLSFQDMDRLFGSFMNQPLSSRLEGREWVPSVDIRETESSFTLTAEVAGLKKEEIEITVEDNVLTLSGERKWEEVEDDNSYRRIERSYGSFSRSFTLPRTVSSEKIEAHAEDGVLTIVVPKAAEARSKRIDIR